MKPRLFLLALLLALVFPASAAIYPNGFTTNSSLREFSFGSNTVASGPGAFAWGQAATSGLIHASGPGTVAIGWSMGVNPIIAEGYGSIAVGTATGDTDDPSLLAIGMGAAAFGNSTKAVGSSTFAAGEGASCSNDFAVAIGYNPRATGNASIALGANSHADGQGSVAIGYGANALGANSVATGAGTWAIGTDSIAIGYGSRVSGYGSFMFQSDDTLEDLMTNTVDYSFWVHAYGGVRLTPRVSVSNVVYEVKSMPLSGTNVTIDLAAGSMQQVALTNFVVFSLSNIGVGRNVSVLCYGSTNSQTTAVLPADVQIFSGASTNVINTNKNFVLSFTCFGAAGSNVVATIGIQP